MQRLVIPARLEASNQIDALTRRITDIVSLEFSPQVPFETVARALMDTWQPVHEQLLGMTDCQKDFVNNLAAQSAVSFQEQVSDNP